MTKIDGLKSKSILYHEKTPSVFLNVTSCYMKNIIWIAPLKHVEWNWLLVQLEKFKKVCTIIWLLLKLLTGFFSLVEWKNDAGKLLKIWDTYMIVKWPSKYCNLFYWNFEKLLIFLLIMQLCRICTCFTKLFLNAGNVLIHFHL